MTEEIQMVLSEAKEGMKGAVDHLGKELTKIRAGRANPSMLDGVMVEYYGSPTPLNQVANVNSLDARTLSIQPWEKSILEDIERGIMQANLGLNPQNNGELIMINIPVLTEERRIELVKKAKSEGEDAKISIRTQRKEANDFIKDLDGLSEDMIKNAEEQVQKLTDEYSEKADKLVEAKEKDIMTV